MSTSNNLYSVYIHINKINNKGYVGITKQQPKVRWGKNGYNYLVKKKDGTFLHPKFANAILKYGWDNFNHIILEENINPENISEREIFYSEIYNTLEDGYNNMVGEFKGRKISEETIKKFSKRSKGSNNPRSKKIIMLDPITKDFLKIFNCANDIARELCLVNGRHIIDCCLGKREIAGGFCWKYYEGEIFEEKDDFLNHKIKSVQRKNRSSPILLYDINNNFIKKFNTIHEASSETKTPISSIRNVLIGKRKQNNGFIWKYENYTPKKYKNKED